MSSTQPPGSATPPSSTPVGARHGVATTGDLHGTVDGADHDGHGGGATGAGATTLVVRPPGPRMDPRTWTMVVSGVAAIILMAVVSMLPLPYALMRPGPVLDVLSDPDGAPLISIQGRDTFTTSGSLDLLTVRVTGGPGSRTTVWDVLRGWADPSIAVRPVDEVFPPQDTEQDVDERNAQEMVTSQEQATVAALNEIGVQVPTTLTVNGFTDGSGATDALRAGDVVTSVGGTRVVDLPQLRDELQRIEPGDDVTIGFTRGGAEQEATFPTAQAEGRTVMGVFIDPTYEFPFEVRIRIEDIGGPSAGMIFALGIVDKLTPGEMTGGERIAGTGTMDSDGAVGPIGGIQQKLVGAQDAGAQWFLAPAANCGEVVGHVPDGLRVVRVETLEQARDAVEAIGSGEASATDALPTCSS